MSQLKAQVDKLLTEVSLRVESKGLVADEVLPQLPVDQYSGLIGKFGDEHLRLEDDLGGGRHEFRRVESIDYSASIGYKIEDHGLEDVVTKQDYANVELPFDAEKDKITGLTQKVMISKERNLSSIMTLTSVLTKNVTLSGTSQFNDYNNSDPLTVFKNAHQSGITEIGSMLNACVLPLNVFNTLRYHPAILEKLGFKDARAGLITIEEMKRALEVEYLYVAEGIYNTAKKGQTAVRAPLWNKDIVFYARPSGIAKDQVSLGYKLVKRGDDARQVYKYALNNPPQSNGLIVHEAYQFKIVMPEAGYLIKNAIA